MQEGSRSSTATNTAIRTSFKALYVLYCWYLLTGVWHLSIIISVYDVKLDIYKTDITLVIVIDIVIVIVIIKIIIIFVITILLS